MAAPDPPASTDDFPYYDGRPVQFTGAQWALLMLAVALGFVALTAHIPLFTDRFGQFIPAILFTAIPLAALAWITPAHWTALFRKVGAREVGWMLLFAALNLLITAAVGWAVVANHGAHTNPAFAMISGKGAVDVILFFLRTLPQLLGEEIITILPMLAIMAFLHQRLKLPRVASILLAWLATGLMFGAIHLPTYSWDFLQCIVVIGCARLVLSLAYLKTKNIWVSTGAHVINDWTMFGIGLLGAAAQAGQ